MEQLQCLCLWKGKFINRLTSDLQGAIKKREGTEEEVSGICKRDVKGERGNEGRDGQEGDLWEQRVYRKSKERI